MFSQLFVLYLVDLIPKYYLSSRSITRTNLSLSRNLTIVPKLFNMPADTVHLVSSEGESFDVASSAACMSMLVSNLIEETGDDDEAQEIPLPNVKSTILALVIEFMNHYESEKMTEIEKVSCPPNCFNRLLTFSYDRTDFFTLMPHILIFPPL